MPSPAPLLLTSLLLLSSAPPAPAQGPPAPPAAGGDDRTDEAIEAIRAGEFEAARTILEGLLLEQYLEVARVLLDEGNPQDGMLWIDRAVKLAPRDPAVRSLRARGSLLLAEVLWSEGAPGAVVGGAFGDALAAYRDAPPSPERPFGASRAALLLGDDAQALDWARQGMEGLAQIPASTELWPPPERTWAEAAFAAYRAASLAEERDPDRMAALWLETEDALMRCVGRSAADPWVWLQLANLNEWGARLGEAQALLERGLDRRPDSDELLARLRDVAWKVGGAPGALAALERFGARHPQQGNGHYHAAQLRFEIGLAGSMEGEAAAEAFQRAEGEFARAAELAGDLAEAALGYRVICRDAAGWCRFNAGDLAGAAAAFRSMDELVERGLTWRLPGAAGEADRLPSGDRGLFFVADAHAQAGELEAAAATFQFLHEYLPDDVTVANATGFWNRDAALELELNAQTLLRAARGQLEPDEVLEELRRAAGIEAPEPGDAAERAAFERRGTEQLARARALMERSLAAYERAVELSPGDVRLNNDVGMILLYYLHRDLERAEQLFSRSVALGTEQLAAMAPDDPGRFDLENAWGDAHQNLGAIELELKGRPDAARPWFERAVEIGPDPRPVITGVWLPRCDGVDVPFAESLAIHHWGQAPTP